MKTNFQVKAIGLLMSKHQGPSLTVVKKANVFARIYEFKYRGKGGEGGLISYDCSYSGGFGSFKRG